MAQTLGLEHAYGASIVLFTVLVRTALFPINYKQLVSAEMTKSLSPKLQEIKEKYADNKDLQNQMTVLLYEKAKVRCSHHHHTNLANSDSISSATPILLPIAGQSAGWLSASIAADPSVHRSVSILLQPGVPGEHSQRTLLMAAQLGRTSVWRTQLRLAI